MTLACRERAGSAVESSPSLQARAHWARSRRRSTKLDTASKGRSLPNSCLNDWHWICSPPGPHNSSDGEDQKGGCSIDLLTRRPETTRLVSSSYATSPLSILPNS